MARRRRRRKGKFFERRGEVVLKAVARTRRRYDIL